MGPADENAIDQLEALLRATAAAHHEAFADVDGEDPEWPAWYADHLLPGARVLLGERLTATRLAELLREADAQRAPDADWVAHYARVLLGSGGGPGGLLEG